MINDDFEKTLPMYVQKDIKALLDGLKDETCTHLDCLWCELSGSINSALNGFEITAEQAKYLRIKYLGMDG